MTQFMKYINRFFFNRNQAVAQQPQRNVEEISMGENKLIEFTLTAFYNLNTEINLTNLAEDLVSCVKDCKDLEIQSISFLEKDGKNKSKHTDDYLQIKCSAKSLLKTRPDLEGHFAVFKNWTQSSDLFIKYKFHEMYRPWLSVEDDKYFYNLCRSCHDHVGLRSVSFGTLISPSHVEIHRSIEPPINDSRRTSPIVAHFFHDDKFAEISFEMIKTKIDLQYSSIRRVYICGTDNSLQLYIEVSNPPFAYSTKVPTDWKPNDKNPVSFKERILTPWANTVIENEEALFLKLVYGKSNIIKLEFDVDRIIGYQIASRLHFRCGKIPIHWVLMNEGVNFGKPTDFINNFKIYIDSYNLKNEQLPFENGYLLNAILERNFVIRLQIGPALLEKFYDHVQQLNQQNVRCLAASLTKSLYLLNEGTLINYWGIIHTLFNYYKEDESKIDTLCLKKPRNTEFIRRVVFTPTQTIYYPPEIMFTNRVLRMARPDFALKVSFRDENYQKLSIPFFCSKQIHESAIKIPMTGDFKVYSRKYKLLGWSNSQLHDHSVWMYAPDDENDDVSTLRAMMGDFTEIKTVSKYMARMGQCFTSTEETILVPYNFKYVKTVPDIYSEPDKKYCFSDGIGKISKNFMVQVCQKINIKNARYPCALQIRYAGYKGMLVLDPTLYSEYIVFRDSMKKFPCPESDSFYLEVVKYSKPTPVYLNRPMIMILDQLGVPYEVFAYFQDAMLKRATSMLLDEEKAANYLNSRCRLPGLDYRKLANAGAGLTVDPFFRTMLLICHKTSIAKIRSKCCYEIDMAKGRTMFGVLDETGKLEYGQVFVQFSTIDHDTDKRTVERLIGKVMVTKNPCMQAGDIRMLKAVDVGELRHIVDCIVFPQTGKRPHPDEMAGSDLDGDEFAVIWDKTLFFARNSVPTNFPVPDVPKVHRDIKEEDIVNFLMHYIQNDIVGKIANAHLAIADKHGIRSPIAASLAQKYSYAVDFAKSGQVKRMVPSERPTSVPDFMEKSGKTYKSKTALGYLYRTCCQFEKINTNYTMAYQNIKLDPEFVYDGWRNYLESALHSRKRYNARLTSLLSWYGLKDEVEAITGNITNINGHKQPESELYVTRQLVNRFIEELWSDFINEFEEEFHDDIDDLDLTLNNLSLGDNARPLFPKKKLQKASAWYCVTYGDADSAILSFPWVVSKYLAAIKNLQRGDKKHTNPLIESLNNELLKPFVLAQLPANITQLDHPRNKHVKAEDAKLAFGVLYKWGLTQRLFSKDMYFEDEKKFNMIFSKFIETIDLPVTNSLTIIINFLLFCSYLPYECDNGSTLTLQDRETLNAKVKHFGFRCMQAYHSLSVSKNFEEFGIQIEGGESNVVVEMEAFKFPIEFVENGKSTGFIKEKRLLKQISGVSEVHIRPVTDKKLAVITASGNINQVRFLEDYLTKEAEKLEDDF